MKKNLSRLCLNAGLFIATFFSSLVAIAQDKGIDVDINVKKESQWYQQTWVWFVGAAVFILLLVALLRGRKTE